MDRDAELEVELAPISAPRPTKVTPSTLAGIIFEAIAGRRQPIEGAEVNGLWLDSPIVATVTDADGRYVLCGLGGLDNRVADGIWVRKKGYLDFVGALALSGPDTVFDVELVPAGGGTP